jgi:hypothetical protein
LERVAKREYRIAALRRFWITWIRYFSMGTFFPKKTRKGTAAASAPAVPPAEEIALFYGYI